MTPLSWRAGWFLALVALLPWTGATAAVTGRYVRLEAIARAMELTEVELYAGDTNLLRGRPELFTGGTGHGLYGPYTGPDALLQQGRVLTDGNTDPAQRGSVGAADPGASWPHLEIDLGRELALDRLVFHVSRWDNPNLKSWFDDPDGWRVVTVLDDQRRVRCSALVTLFTPEYRAARGVMTVPLTAGEGPFQGRAIPVGSRGWFTPGEFLIHYLGVPEITAPGDAGSAARQAEFTRRDEPAALARLAEDFGATLDLTRPGLAEVRRQLAAGRPVEALRAFNQQFLKQLEYLDAVTLGGVPEPEPDRLSGLMMVAEDLVAQRRVDLRRKTVLVAPPGVTLDFTPTGVPWQELHPRALLTAYAATGDRRYLLRWAELVDEWALFFQRWADAGDRREYFPLNLWQRFLRLGQDLVRAARRQPDFLDALPPATLARFLGVIVEEYPPATWRLARTTVFNHQFNIWGGAYLSARVLEDFHVGQRLEREVVQQFERLWTLGVTRDGSMIEVADEGHMACPLGTAAHLWAQLKVDRPAWFDRERETWFRHQYLNVARYLVRFVAPHGREHRSGLDGNYFGRLDSLLLRTPENPRFRYVQDFAIGGGVVEACADILREPEVRAILETVYGRGRPVEGLSRAELAEREVVAGVLGGDWPGPPRTVSDMMPYAGIHYLRRDWSRDAGFMEMVCQPAPGSANDRYLDQLGENWWGSEFFDTQLKYWDYGSPLLLARPVRVDGQQQCHSYETRGWKPGSKTERLTRAPEKPLPNRFHCSADYDYQECFYHGAYQTWELDYPPGAQAQLKITGPAITGVHTTRQVFQLRAQRLFVVVDRLRFSDDEAHRLQARYLLLPTEPGVAVQTDSARGEIRLERAEGPRLTIHQCGPADLRYETLKPLGSRPYLAAEWTARGETVLVSMLAPAPGAAERPVTTFEPLPAGDAIGFTATVAGGQRVLFSVPARLPREAEPAPEQALLAVGAGANWSGLSLGSGAVALPGRTLTVPPDCEFRWAGAAAPATTPIYRPLDPPTVAPARQVFVDELTVSLTSATPETEIRYTVDGSEPTGESPLYRGPFVIRDDCDIQARAFRPGQREIPFATDGTRVSAISFGRFRRAPLKPAVTPPAGLRPGLAYDYLEGGWFRLFASGDRLAPLRSGVTERLGDVSMRATDGPFAVRYHGYLDVPADGVYTFHAPPEYIDQTCEPGYDLRVFVAGEEWAPGGRWHGLGLWSIPLQRGLHRFLVVYADARARDIDHQRIDYWRGYPAPWVVWRGEAPELLVSGPGREARPLPASWLRH